MTFSPLLPIQITVLDNATPCPARGWFVSVAQSLLRCLNTDLVSRGTPIALGNPVQCRGREVQESWFHSSREPRLVGWSQGGLLLLGPVDGEP